VTADLFDVRRIRAAQGLLAAFNEAGVLAPADVHVAATLGRIAGEDDERVLLAAALAVRGPRLGHVYADLATVHETVTVDEDAGVDVAALPWPEAAPWPAVVASSPLVGEDAPLRLDGSRLYLDRYWRYEQRVLGDLRARARADAPEVDEAVLEAGLDRLFGPDDPTDPDLQRAAAALAVRRRFAVIAGGPGTGKTTTVSRILELLDAQAAAAERPPPRVALAAPTGKAAARLSEAIGTAGLEASTIHRLLGTQPGNRTRFRADRAHPLPHDVVIVDETSMVSLALMAKLLDAVRPDARLVLVGDPDQLASVEAGTVLADLVAGLPDAVVVLRRVHRFRPDSGIAALADAIQRGDPEAAVDVLTAGRADVRWVDREEDAIEAVRAVVAPAAMRVVDVARAGDAAGALAAVGALRVLCAHRRGPFGVATWVRRIEDWFDGLDRTDDWYVGRPVLVTANDYQLGVFNGDVGVVVAQPDAAAPMVAFDVGGGPPRLLSAHRLDAVETVHAMTIHKSQGSQFATVVVVLPDAASPLLTRELLYTAVTRAQESLVVVGSADAVRAAVGRRVDRASGLAGALRATAASSKEA
jgi:exodeoxyribonuclease V alpha subunit